MGGDRGANCDDGVLRELFSHCRASTCTSSHTPISLSNCLSSPKLCQEHNQTNCSAANFRGWVVALPPGYSAERGLDCVKVQGCISRSDLNTSRKEVRVGLKIPRLTGCEACFEATSACPCAGQGNMWCGFALPVVSLI